MQERTPRICRAYDITPEEHMAVQATIQRFIDSCISKTINLPEQFDPATMIEDAVNYMPYLKGMTIYRAGSKGNEPLQAIPLTKEMSNDTWDNKTLSEQQTSSCVPEGECG